MKIVRRLYFEDEPTLRARVFTYLSDCAEPTPEKLYRQFPDEKKSTLRNYLKIYRDTYEDFGVILRALGVFYRMVKYKFKSFRKVSLEEEKASEIIKNFLEEKGIDTISFGKED